VSTEFQKQEAETWLESLAINERYADGAGIIVKGKSRGVATDEEIQRIDESNRRHDAEIRERRLESIEVKVARLTACLSPISLNSQSRPECLARRSWILISQ
jgi:hypothetical protein